MEDDTEESRIAAEEGSDSSAMNEVIIASSNPTIDEELSESLPPDIIAAADDAEVEVINDGIC